MSKLFPLMSKCFMALDVENYRENSKCLPSGIAIGRHGEYVVVDNSNALIRVFDPTGRRLLVIGEGKLSAPWDIAVTSTAYRYVVTDTHTCDVKLFSPQGDFVANSSESFHLSQPRGIAYDANCREMAVADAAAECVYIHNPRGIVEAVVRLPDQTTPNTKPEYVTFDIGGHLYVTYTHARCVCRYDRDVEERRRLVFKYDLPGTPAGVCIDLRGNVLVVDYDNARVHVLDVMGNFMGYALTEADGLYTPRALAFDRRGQLVMTDNSGTVKVFDYDRALNRMINLRNVSPERLLTEQTSSTNRVAKIETVIAISDRRLSSSKSIISVRKVSSLTFGMDGLHDDDDEQ